MLFFQLFLFADFREKGNKGQRGKAMCSGSHARRGSMSHWLPVRFSFCSTHYLHLAALCPDLVILLPNPG